MTIMITGGAGFIGSNLAKELAKEHSIIILDNLHTGSYDNLKDIKQQISIINDSCNNINKLDSNIKNIDYSDIDMVFHFGIPSSSPMYKENPLLTGEAINGTISIFEFAKKHEIEKVIYASSSSLYNGIKPPHREDMNIRVTDYYTEARLTIERIARLYNNLYGIKSAGLRFFSVYGPNESAKGRYANMISQFLWDMKEGKSPVIYGDGRQTRDFTYVKDVVDACLLLMNSAPQSHTNSKMRKQTISYSAKADNCLKLLSIEHNIFNVGTGISHSFNDVIEILNEKLKTDIKPTYVEIPMKNYIDHTLADITEIKRLGYRPKYTLEQGIDELIRK